MDTRRHFERVMARELGVPRDSRYAIYSANIWKTFLNMLPDRYAPILDVGCGGGGLLYALEKEGFRALHGCDFIDVVPDDLLTTNASIQTCDFLLSDYDNAAFKAVISTMVIEHVLDERRFIDKVHYVLKTGGIALITSVLKKSWAWYFYKNDNGDRVIEPSHVREYKSVYEFVRLFEDKFDVVMVDTPVLKYPVVDPLLRFAFRTTGCRWFADAPMRSRVFCHIRKIRIPIWGYYAIEVIVRKR